MHRRPHRKSRRGCAECKRRHMKCDETRPRCVNCSMVDRECVFPLSIPITSLNELPSPERTTAASSKTTTPDRDATTGSPGRRSPAIIPTPDLAHLTGNESIRHCSDVGINMNHMKLLVHFSLKMAIPELEDGLLERSTQLILKTGVDTPYLLHEVLALSARHLSVIEPERSSEYLNDAVQLQTRAISLFNAQRAQIDESTCVPMVLFSSILGRHLCIDALAFRGDDLDTFLDCYVSFLRIRRGVKTIVNRAWPLLKESELCPLMAWGMDLGRLRTQGHHCDGILSLLAGSKDLSVSSLESCRGAIELIQIAMDDHEVRMLTRAKHVYQMVFAWSLLVKEDFAEMLTQRVPEALAALAHYAAILHLARDLWQIGDSGAYLLGIVSGYLGVEWEEWLCWPRSIVSPENITDSRLV